MPKKNKRGTRSEKKQEYRSVRGTAYRKLEQGGELAHLVRDPQLSDRELEVIRDQTERALDRLRRIKAKIKQSDDFRQRR